MGYMTDGLTFNTLRGGNTARLPEFRAATGALAHANADGSDWSLNDWMTAVTGELGEAANVLKKIRRGDFTLDEARPKLEQEFSDVVIYLDILAKRAGIDLGAAVMQTFNAKSVQVGSRVRLAADDWHYVAIPVEAGASTEGAIMIICDGCNVRDPWEHRCHGSNAYVRGERTGLPCECHQCREDASKARQVHAVGCLCGDCSATYERDAWDPRMGQR
jgi:NTP pyrophosphatase (non-canonical NTP hydrolase)